MSVLAVVALLLAAPAAAQGAAPQPVAPRACLAAAASDREAERACIGGQSLACIAADPARTAAVMSACIAAEAAAWDAVLNATFGDLVAIARDRARAEDPAATAPDPHERRLQRAQAAWAAFREADCLQEAAQWGAAPMRDVAGARCRLERGATRTLELMARRRAYETRR